MRADERVRRGPRGYTLFEIIVALAIVVVMSAVVAPSLIGVADSEQADSALETVENLAQAVVTFAEDVRRYPQTLTQLTTALTTTSRNSCNQLYSSAERDRWDGPYVTRVLTSAGVPVGLGTIADLLVRVPATGTSTSLGILMMNITGVNEEQAAALDLRVDAADGAAGGTLRWGTPPSADGLVVVEYHIPIRGC